MRRLARHLFTLISVVRNWRIRRRRQRARWESRIQRQIKRQPQPEAGWLVRRREQVRLRRIRADRCPDCDVDLRAGAERCPECGAAAAMH